MAIKKNTMPFVPWRGLHLDGTNVPGGMTKATNVILMQDGTAERRAAERTLSDSEDCLAGRGTKKVFELQKSDGARYIYANIDNSETSTSAFESELVTGASALTAWTDVSDWALDTDHWDHGGTGTTSLVGKPAVTASTLYRLVVTATCPAASVSGSYWAYTSTDSGSTWTDYNGTANTIWLNKWTHSAGGTTALTTESDFTVESGASYVITVYVTHTSGTSLSVYVGDTLAGTISSTGSHTFIARYVTTVSYDYVRFVPTSNWVGSVEKSWPWVPLGGVNKWCSCIKLITPDAENLPSNYDYTESTHLPKELYLNGAELFYQNQSNWYPALTANLSQSCAVYLGATLAGVISASGEYSYDVTTTNTTAVTFTPTTAWGGSITACSIKAMTQGSAATRCKVIGGLVTGTTDYETTWANIVTDLTSGDTVHPTWAALQDRAFLVDGTNPNRWFNDASSSHTLGCPAPAQAPIAASTTGGSLTAADYNVAYSYVKRSGNYIVEGNPSPSTYVSVAGTAITINVIACTDSDVTHIRIYRTLYGESGSNLYLDQEVNNATTTVTIKNADADLRDINSTLEYDHDMPPLGKFVLGAGSRLWLVDTVGTLHWSNLDQPEIMPSMNYMTFDPKDGDEPMGLCPLRKHLMYFKKRKTWLIDMFSESVSDDGVAALAKDVVSSTYGCIAPGSIQAVGTDSAIWLSHAGFLHYNGGRIRNISSGYIDSDGNVTPSRIQTVINEFLANGAAHLIDSAYHSARQLYHVNFIYRNVDNNTIVKQRHFVYNIQTDTWTEFVYYNSAGARQYETNLAIAHDSLGNEVILIPYISDTTETTTYIFQAEYDAANYSQSDYVFYSCDNTDLIYVYRSSYVLDSFEHITSANHVKYICYAGSGILIGGGNISKGDYAIYRSTDYGSNWESLENDPDWAECESLLSLGSGIVLAAINTPDGDFIYKSDDYGETWTKIAWDYSTYTVSYLTDVGSGVVLAVVSVGGVYSVLKSSDSGDTWAAVSSAFFTALAANEMSEIIYIGNDTVMASAADATSDTGYHLIKSTNGGTTWTNTGVDCGTPHICYLQGGVIMCGRYRSTDSGATFTLNSEIDDIFGVSSTQPIYCDMGNGYAIVSFGAFLYMSKNYGYNWSYRGELGTDPVNIIAFSVDSGYWETSTDTVTEGSTKPTLYGTPVDIVSNYSNLGMPNEKRVCRCYLPFVSQYACGGAMTIEPDHGVNVASHTDGESTEPAGATSLRPFAHTGSQTWTYTNEQFDSTEDQWQDLKIDIGCNGKAFRYSIQAGDLVDGRRGTMRIRPPFVDVQVKSKQ